MRKSFLTILPLLVLGFWLSAQMTTQEKLGYSKDTKLLIIHADDLGVSHSTNVGSTKAIETGSVSSASIMVPTPWFTEIASYAAAHPTADLGLHLTLTSEWKNYRWGGIAGRNEIPGLLNKRGFLYPDVDSVYKMAKLKEVETELRAQIEKAKLFGIDFTHFDSHMATLYGTKEYLKLLMTLGREYKVPVMLNKTGPRSVMNFDLGDFVTDKDVLLDNIITASPMNFKNGMENFYTNKIKELKAGLSIFIIHTAFDDEEMKAITIEHADWGATWRQDDYNFFTSEKCKQLLKDNNVKVITWREVRDKLLRGDIK